MGRSGLGICAGSRAGATVHRRRPAGAPGSRCTTASDLPLAPRPHAMAAPSRRLLGQREKPVDHLPVVLAFRVAEALLEPLLGVGAALVVGDRDVDALV